MHFVPDCWIAEFIATFSWFSIFHQLASRTRLRFTLILSNFNIYRKCFCKQLLLLREKDECVQLKRIPIWFEIIIRGCCLAFLLYQTLPIYFTPFFRREAIKNSFQFWKIKLFFTLKRLECEFICKCLNGLERGQEILSKHNADTRWTKRSQQTLILCSIALLSCLQKCWNEGDPCKICI